MILLTSISNFLDYAHLFWSRFVSFPKSDSLYRFTKALGQAKENEQIVVFFLHIAKKLTNWQTAKVTDDQIHIKTASGRAPSNIVYCK